jgi:TniQ
MRPWQRPTHQLPIIVRPAAGELLVSYLARLADANGVPAGHLLSWVGECGTVPREPSRRRDGWLNHAARCRLETVTGLPAATLVRALPGLGSPPKLGDGHPHPDMPVIRWRPEPPAARWVAACPGCTARPAGAPPVVVEQPSSRRLCRRHRQWLHRDGSFPVTAEIARAQRVHDRLVRRRGRELAAESYLRAASIARDWWGRPWHPVLQRRWDRRLWALGVLGGPVPDQLLRAVLHPEAVALAGMLACPSWDARLRAGHATVWDFHRAVAARLALDARRPTTAEPLVRWLTMGHPWAGRCPRGLQLQHEDLLPPLAQLEVGQGAAAAAHRGGSDARR